MNNRTNWVIDHMNTEIGFTISHLMVDTIKGSFKHYDALIHTIDDDFTTAEIDMCIDAASVDTGHKDRDEYLKSEDFFNTKEHQYILFNSLGINKTNTEDVYELEGALTIKDKMQKLKLELRVTEIVKDITGKERVSLKAEGRISRKTWGLNWNTLIAAGGLMVDEEITIMCDIQLIKGLDKGLLMKTDAPKKEITIPSLTGIAYR